MIQGMRWATANCFVINLDKRTDRLEAFAREFEQKAPGLAWERFAAIKTEVARNPVVNGRIGCLLSHRRVVEMARERGLEYAIVFEDDVELVQGAGERWARAIEQLEGKPWQLLFLGQNTMGPVWKEADHLYRVSRSVALHAVVYHRRSYDEILHRLPNTEAESLRFVAKYKAIDLFFARHLIPRVPAYCVWPHLAHQKPDRSDIQGALTQGGDDDDQRTERWIVESAIQFRIRCAAWRLFRMPWYRVMEQIQPLKKRKLYKPAK